MSGPLPERRRFAFCASAPAGAGGDAIAHCLQNGVFLLAVRKCFVLSRDGKYQRSPGRKGRHFNSLCKLLAGLGALIARKLNEDTTADLARISPSSPPGAPPLLMTTFARGDRRRSSRAVVSRERSVTAILRSPHARRAAHITADARAKQSCDRIAVGEGSPLPLRKTATASRRSRGFHRARGAISSPKVISSAPRADFTALRAAFSSYF